MQLLTRYAERRPDGSSLVFVTAMGEKVSHVAHELEKFSESFGRKFNISPTLNRKQVATVVGLNCSKEEEKSVAKHMTHSLAVHRASYQHAGDEDVSISWNVTK